MTLSTNDKLALDRTLLANERTLLAYVRSAFALFIAGMTFIKLFGSDLVFFQFGWGLIILAPLALLLGFMRTRSTHKRIQSYYEQPAA